MAFPREIVAKKGSRALIGGGKKLLHTGGFLEQPTAGGNCPSSENSLPTGNF